VDRTNAAIALRFGGGHHWRGVCVPVRSAKPHCSRNPRDNAAVSNGRSRMKYFDKLDQQFTSAALFEEQRAARIAELTARRKSAAWGVLFLLITELAALTANRGGAGFLAFLTVCFLLQFQILNMQIRTLKVVDALMRDRNVTRDS
jgi:hypothetical protein